MDCLDLEKNNVVTISIITVCLNAVETIERTIKSVLSQHYQKIEYIIIDGGSTDGTIDIIKKYSDRISFWTSEKDNGVFDAMNKGVQFASGELISFLNANDWYEPDIISVVVSEYNKTDSDVLYGDIYLVHSERREVYRNKNMSLFSFSNHFPILQPASFVRRELLKKYPFDTSYQIASDAKWFWLIARRGYKFHYLNMLITNFTKGGLSFQTDKVSKEWKKAALTVSQIEIERHYQYWRFIDNEIDDGFHDFFIDYIKNSFSGTVYVVGAGLVCEQLIPYMEKANVNISAFFADNEKSISYNGKTVITQNKKAISNDKNALIFIASETHAEEIAKEISGQTNQDNIVLFPLFFTDAVENYISKNINRGKLN